MQNKFKKKFSIVIATNNSENTIIDCLKSIKQQSFKNYEIIIIDNCSSDKTIKLVKSFKFKKIKILIEKDKGIYDAINKGIKLSRGEIISILHSDDKYYNKNVLKTVDSFFIKYNKLNAVYGDLVYVNRNNLKKIIRKWIPGEFIEESFFYGWNPPHPTFFVKRKIYNKYGLYNQKLGNPADIELMFRYLYQKKINYRYINKFLILMRYGGESNKSFLNIVNQNIKILSILKIEKNLFKVICFIYGKLINRLSQFIK